MKPQVPLNGDQGLALPVSAEKLVPHRPPMLLIDKLFQLTADEAVVEARISEGNLLAEETGRVDPIVTLEIMAQAYAAAKGYRDLVSGMAFAKGFLVGARKFIASEALHVGDVLRISVKTVASIGGFAVAEAVVARAGCQIAAATLKLWVPESAGETKG